MHTFHTVKTTSHIDVVKALIHSDHSMTAHVAHGMSLGSNHEIMTVLAALQSLLNAMIMLLLILLHGFLCR